MTAFERWSVRSSSIVVAATGFGLLWLKYGMESPDPFAVVNHPLQIWALKSHVLVAPLFVLAIGFITVRHIWRHIVRGVQPGRRSGLTTVVALVPMAISGYLIQVLVSDTLRTAVIVIHIGSSAVFTAGAGIHFVLMWRHVRSAPEGAVPERTVVDGGAQPGVDPTDRDALVRRMEESG